MPVNRDKGKTKQKEPAKTALGEILPDLPQDVQENVEMARGIARSLGSALALTITVGVLKPGHSAEDEAMDAMSDAWTALADKIMLFVLSERD